MRKYLFLYYFLFTSFMLMLSISINAQDCLDTSYKKLYSSPYANLINFQYQINKDDTAILAGNYCNNLNNDTAIYIIKLSPSGNVVWAKKLSTPNKSRPYNLIELNNGDILVSFYSPEDIDIIKIAMLNSMGNLVWAKKISTTVNEFSSNHYIFNINSSENKLYLSGMSSRLNGNMGEFGNSTIIKLDNHANVLWSKYYTNNNGCNSSVPVGLIKVKDSLLVIGRMTTECSGYLNGERESSYYGMKVNEQDGELGKSVAYTTPLDFGHSYAGIGGGNYFNLNITNTTNNEFYFSAHQYRPYPQLNGRYKVRFDVELNVYGRSLYTADATIPRFSKIDVDAQGNTNMVYYGADSIGYSNLYFAKFDQNNNIIRQKRLSSPNCQSYFSGCNPFAYKRNYMSLLTNYKNIKGNYLQLAQLNNEEQNSSCFGEDSNFIKISPYIIEPYLSPFFNSAADLPVNVTDIDNVVVSDILVVKEDVCEKMSLCNSIKLTGTDTICDLNQNYIFKIKLNATCYKHVSWQIDTTAISHFAYVDDTTVSIKFKNKFEGYLYASVNSCTYLKDSIRIHVFNSPDTINLGSDTSFCTGTEVYLDAKEGFRNYLWQNGDTNSFFVAKYAGKYFVRATDYCGNILFDTINLAVNELTPINIGHDTSICIKQSILLDAGIAFAEYMWNTGETTQTISVSNAGMYVITAKNLHACISTDSMYITSLFPRPVFSLGKKTALCKGQNDTLFVNGQFVSYLWQDESTSKFYKVLVPGKIKVTVTNELGCSSADSVYIQQLITVPVRFLIDDSAICKGESIILQANTSFADYLWSNGYRAPSIVVSEGTYWLQAKDFNGCMGVDSVIIIRKDCETAFFVPTAFSPNDDGLNETFKPHIAGRIESYDFVVYNRWGALIYRTKDINSGWNGEFKGSLQNSGTYVWHCKYKAKGESEIIANGTFILFR